MTARHCLTKDQKEDIAKIAARLHIPFALQGSTGKEDDYVEFSSAISLKHDSEDIPGELIDLVVLEVNIPQDGKKRKQLLHRSVKLCSGLMNPDTDLGENGRHEEVSDEQATTYVFPGVQTASRLSGA
ncbi:hypothetical protein NX907_25080, partial [Burkholderia thailandensis]|uniref:hypothetical protein n=1 Tax=Burkholderia thailandensis TaxID=57975 RepID=UPI00217D9EF4